MMGDARRLNVALTRARAKLIIVGSPATVRSLPVFSQLLGIMHAKGWLLSLPPNALAECRALIPGCMHMDL